MVFPIIIICVVQVFVQLSRSSAGNGILDLYSVYAYGVGAEVLGVLAAVATAVSCPATFMAGQVMDRYGRRKTIIPGFTLVGTSMMFLALIAATSLPSSRSTWWLSSLRRCVRRLRTDHADPRRGHSAGNARGKFFGLWKLIGETSMFIRPGDVHLLFYTRRFRGFVHIHGSERLCRGALTLFFVKETLNRPSHGGHRNRLRCRRKRWLLRRAQPENESITTRGDTPSIRAMPSTLSRSSSGISTVICFMRNV